MLIFCLAAAIKSVFGYESIFFDLTSLNAASVGMLVLAGYFIFLIFKKDIKAIQGGLYKFRNFLLIFYYAVGVGRLIAEAFKEYSHTYLYRFGGVCLVAFIVWGSVKFYIACFSTKTKETEI